MTTGPTEEQCGTPEGGPDGMPLALEFNEGLGVAVLVDGAVVAWFAEMDDYAEDFCRENWFGRWLTWRATAPQIVPLTPEEQVKCENAAQELAASLRFE